MTGKRREGTRSGSRTLGYRNSAVKNTKRVSSEPSGKSTPKRHVTFWKRMRTEDTSIAAGNKSPCPAHRTGPDILIQCARITRKYASIDRGSGLQRGGGPAFAADCGAAHDDRHAA